MRGFLDDDEIAAISGGAIGRAEFFDPVEKSIELIKRAELVMGEISLLQDDLKDIWNEARDYEIDPAVLKTVITRRKKAKHEVEQLDIAVGNLELRMDGRNLDGEDYDEEENGERRRSRFDDFEAEPGDEPDPFDIL